MVLRDEQMRELRRSRRERFLERALVEVRRHWPQLAASTGPEELRRRVRRGIGRAWARGLDEERLILRWLNVECALGPGFETDPAHPGIQALLAEDPAADPQDLMDRLSRLTLEELRRRGEPAF